jgi:hypothetical protein
MLGKARYSIGAFVTDSSPTLRSSGLPQATTNKSYVPASPLQRLLGAAMTLFNFE